MLIDYAHFGDVVSLDTTYCTNRAQRPLAIFSGFNHYRGVIIFGAALMYDETAESFKWLFEIFLEAHMQKKPQTIFTDQDQAMAKTLRDMMPETCHGLCTWHLMQNGIKHLGNLMKNDSHFLRDFKACMYKYVEEMEFEDAWRGLLSTYNVQENRWLKSVYNIKEKWAACYMKKMFTLGMRSTQISESINSDFKELMCPSLNIIKFFRHFERVVEEKRYNELKCECESRQKVLRFRSHYSPLIRQVAPVYTYTLFEAFQEEFDRNLAACVKSKSENLPIFQYTITIVDEVGEWKVSFDPLNKSISCGCKKFESFGILYCHTLKVLDVTDVKVVPDQYILKRWTKQARGGVVHNVKGNEVKGDAKLATTRRYREICPLLIRIATEASGSHEAFLYLCEAANRLSAEVSEICSRQRTVDNDASDTIGSESQSVLQPMGFKKRDGRKGKKRLKGWVEKQSKGKRKPTEGNGLKNQNLQMDNTYFPSQVQFGSPPVYFDRLNAPESQFSFTRLLLDPLQSFDDERNK